MQFLYVEGSFAVVVFVFKNFQWALKNVLLDCNQTLKVIKGENKIVNQKLK